MVSIILSILKIIGIILLCILGLLITAVLVVLFVPIRYKVLANSNINDTDKDYHVTARFSWLLCLVRGKYEYPSDKGLVVKVGPFTVYGGPEKEKSSQKKKKGKDKKKDILSNESQNLQLKEGSEKISGDNKKEADDSRNDVNVNNDNVNEKKAGRKSLKEKILYTRQRIYDKINKICTKIKYILANIRKYLDIIKTVEFTEAFALCKSSLLRLFRMIKPRKLKVCGKIGMKSPDQTGYVCAVIGVISPFFKKQIQIIPDFENYVVEGKILIKGRVYLFVVLIIGIKVFFDKNIRKVIDMFHKEVIVNEQ